jgi:hypothetical protein
MWSYVLERRPPFGGVPRQAPVFEELDGYVLSFRGRATQGDSAEAT